MPTDNNNTAPAPADADTAADQRLQQLRAWVREQTGITDPGRPASSDASFRRYFRFQQGSRSLVAMDAPPASEDCRPFIHVAALLRDAGVAVPEIVADDLERGFLLLSDLGPQTYLQAMTATPPPVAADTLFERAITALLQSQQIAATDSLPRYDRALLRRELDLFPTWYLQRHLQQPPDPALAAALETLFEQLIEQVTGQAQVFVHRDFMPRNLMVMADAAGVLDFQDAVCGPISYDPICLFKDAFISWPEARVQGWLRDYWQRARALGLPVPADFDDFLRDCDFMGVQRHLKVIGIFARICHRDGKPHYLGDVPRFFTYLDTVAARRPELSALRTLLERLA